MASSRAEETPAKSVQVIIDHFAFSPQTLTVPIGTSVAWLNHDSEPHSVRGTDAKELRSDALDEDQSFTFTFSTPGTYTYYCSLHPHMTGTVIVR